MNDYMITCTFANYDSPEDSGNKILKKKQRNKADCVWGAMTTIRRRAASAPWAFEIVSGEP
jgi:hypothetical protein